MGIYKFDVLFFSNSGGCSVTMKDKCNGNLDYNTLLIYIENFYID